jgi:hypothetical protein
MFSIKAYSPKSKRFKSVNNTNSDLDVDSNSKNSGNTTIDANVSAHDNAIEYTSIRHHSIPKNTDSTSPNVDPNSISESINDSESSGNITVDANISAHDHTIKYTSIRRPSTPKNMDSTSPNVDPNSTSETINDRLTKTINAMTRDYTTNIANVHLHSAPGRLGFTRRLGDKAVYFSDNLTDNEEV